MKILKSNGISAFGGLNFVIEELDNKEIGKILNEVLPKVNITGEIYFIVIGPSSFVVGTAQKICQATSDLAFPNRQSSEFPVPTGS